MEPTARIVITAFQQYLPTVLSLLAAIVVAKLMYGAAMSRWHMAKPNEWMLLLRNGELVQAGVGLSAFCPPGSQIVRFPSTMQETEFTASQATKQRAGVSVTGKAYWSIYRPSKEDPDGPFRAFKSLSGLANGDFTAGNEKVKTLAISTIRDAVSNMTIMEVMTSRNDLKERVKADIIPIFRGWGMWLETVEILDVRVESRSLFDDMQYLRSDMLDFDTKADAHVAAEKAKLVAQSVLDADRLANKTHTAKQRANAEREQGVYAAQQQLKREEGEAQLEAARQQLKLDQLAKEEAMQIARLAQQTTLAKQRADADTEQGVYAAQQRLRREEGEAELQEKRQQLELDRLAKQQQVAMKKLEDSALLQDADTQQQLKVEALKREQEHRLLSARYAIEADLTPANLTKAGIEATQAVFSNLPLRDVKLVSLAGSNGCVGDSSTGVGAGLLPNLAETWTALSNGSNSSD